MTRALAPVLGLAAAAAIAGCGGGGDDGADPAADSRAPSQRAPAPKVKANPVAVRVIRGWTDTLRHGDVRGAARYFSIPTIVQNNTPPIQLRNRESVEYFNRTLPCGAVLVRAVAMGTYTVAVFRLTERPGEGVCGTGAGREAAVAFIVARRHITQWRRLTEVPPADGPSDRPPPVASGPAV